MFVCVFRFLTLLAKFDWKHSPLVVDFSSEISVEQRTKIEVGQHLDCAARTYISLCGREGGGTALPFFRCTIYFFT